MNDELIVQNLDHLGIVAGLVDELEIVEQINQHLGEAPREQISPGVVVKAMILNGLGLVSAPLYLFEQFFVPTFRTSNWHNRIKPALNKASNTADRQNPKIGGFDDDRR